MKTFVAITVLCPMFFSACKTLDLTAHWRDGKVTIDGNATDWEGNLTSVEEGVVRIGMMNDSTDLYFCLVTSDKDLERQVIRTGLSIWFDRTGGENKSFGIRFPLPRYMPYDRDRRARTEGEPPDTAADALPPLSGEVEVFGPEEHKSQRMTLLETGGIDVRLGHANNTFVYEAKIPLIDYGPTPFAIGARPGSIIGIGIETASREIADRGGPTPPSGIGRRGGGRRGRSEFGTTRAGGGTMKPISISLKTTLAGAAEVDSSRTSKSD